MLMIVNSLESIEDRLDAIEKALKPSIEPSLSDYDEYKEL